MNGVLSVFRNFDSWTAKISISELTSQSRNSTNFGWIPSAFHWWILSLFWKAIGRGWEGVEFVGPGSWQLVDAVRRFCWSLVHFSHFHWSSRVEAYGPVLHFWWKPFWHSLYLTGTMWERKAAEHLGHFSLEFLASAKDMPWFKSEFNDAGVGCAGEASGWVDEYPLAVGEECRWQCQIGVESIRALVGPPGFIKPPQVAARWQILSQEGSAQW